MHWASRFPIWELSVKISLTSTIAVSIQKQSTSALATVTAGSILGQIISPFQIICSDIKDIFKALYKDTRQAADGFPAHKLHEPAQEHWGKAGWAPQLGAPSNTRTLFQRHTSTAQPHTQMALWDFQMAIWKPCLMLTLTPWLAVPLGGKYINMSNTVWVCP